VPKEHDKMPDKQENKTQSRYEKFLAEELAEQKMLEEFKRKAQMRKEARKNKAAKNNPLLVKYVEHTKKIGAQALLNENFACALKAQELIGKACGFLSTASKNENKLGKNAVQNKLDLNEMPDEDIDVLIAQLQQKYG